MNQRIVAALLTVWLAGPAMAWAGGNPEDMPQTDPAAATEPPADPTGLPADPASIPAVETPEPCQAIDKNPIRIEGWINREHRKHHRKISKEFEELQYTNASIKVFPMGQTAKVVAVGRCVPAYIARHVLEKSLQYTGGIESLVNQAFLPTNWIAIGTTQFDEPSQQVVTPEQVKELMNPDLSDEEFHTLYRKYSVQDDTVKYFGRTTTNAKKVD